MQKNGKGDLLVERILPSFPRMEPNIVILAGGASSRMKSFFPGTQPLDAELLRQAATLPKCMLAVGPGARPFMDYVLLSVARAGYRDVVVVVTEGDDQIRPRYERVGPGREFSGLRLTFVEQPVPAGRTKPLGTADALQRALTAMDRWRGAKCTVCNSDNLYSLRALRLLLLDGHAGAMIDYDRAALQYPAERIVRFSVIRKDAGGFLTGIIEKPAPEQMLAAADRGGRVGVSMNIFRFSCSTILPLLDRIPLDPVRNERELPAAVNHLVQQDPHAMFAIPLAEHVIDLTSPADIPAVQAYIRERFPGALFPPETGTGDAR
jgi:NDP-sugar pyrophosphorylase family protein